MLRICGINLNDELQKPGDEKLLDFKEILISQEGKVCILSTAIYFIKTNGNKLEVNSTLTNKQKSLEFKMNIRKICATNDVCWVLLDGGALSSYDFIEESLKEIPLANIIDVACTNSFLYCIDDKGQLHQVTAASQNKIHEFHKHQKVKKMVSGAEHCVLLTSNGDIFSFGCGLRGALGHGDVNSKEQPAIIEALAGLKVVDIAAGSFHSIAVSSFGDVYSWGWNTNGQLGLPKVAQHTFENMSSSSHQQVFTTPQLIELEDDNEAIKNVHCGSKHTILRTERNRLLVAGLNNYGQLGLSSVQDDVDKFTEIPVKSVTDKTKIFCGYWATYLLDN